MVDVLLGLVAAGDEATLASSRIKVDPLHGTGDSEILMGVGVPLLEGDS
jgi:hypothetical protein